MAREPIVSSSGRRQGDDDPDRDLRPQRMRDMIGQLEVVRTIANRASTRRESAARPWGTSSSTARLAWARRHSPSAFRTSWALPTQLTSGPVLKAPKDLVPYLTNAEERSRPVH